MKNKNIKKNIKKNIELYILLLLFSIVLCKNFLQVHYSSDTWNIKELGYLVYPTKYFLTDARIFSTLVLYIAYFLNMELDLMIVIMEFLAICIQTASVLLLYNMLMKHINRDTKKIKYCVLLSSYVIIFNYMAIEYLLFFECAIMCSGVLFSILAVKVYLSDKKYKNLFTFILLWIAIHCYQGSIGIFLVIILLILFISEKNSKVILKKIIQAVIIFSLVCIVNIINISIINKFILGKNQGRFGFGFFKNNTFMQIFDIIYKAFILNLNYTIPYLNIVVFSSSLLLIIFNKNRNKKYLFIYIILTISCIFMSIYYNLFVKSDMYCLPRMCFTIGAFAGVSIYYLIYINNSFEKNKSIINNVIVLFATMYFIYNSYVYIDLSSQHIKANKIYFEMGNTICEKINEYEKENNTEVKYIARCNDEEFSELPFGIRKLGSLTENPLLMHFSNKTYLKVLTGREFKWVDMDIDVYEEYFQFKNWDEFSEEQIQIKNDTIYICLF